MLNALTVDVEDWYHVTTFRALLDRVSWDHCEHRVERNVHRFLTLLQRYRTKATFFVLGWVAERFPHIVRAIFRDGHEVGIHGYGHQFVYEQTEAEFSEDIRRAREAVEKVTGVPVLGHRAAAFSITERSLWALDVLKEHGIRYDSSVFPVRHSVYGIPGSPRFPYLVKDGLWECPPTTLSVSNLVMPFAGGAVFRMLPHWAIERGIRRVNGEGHAAVLYFHPWDLDPGQPRPKGLPWKVRWLHYGRIEATEGKLIGLLQRFRFGRCKDILPL